MMTDAKVGWDVDKDEKKSWKEKYSDWKDKGREKKELNLQLKENQAVYELTLKIMKQENLTWDQVQECYR